MPQIMKAQILKISRIAKANLKKSVLNAGDNELKGENFRSSALKYTFDISSSIQVTFSANEKTSFDENSTRM